MTAKSNTDETRARTAPIRHQIANLVPFMTREEIASHVDRLCSRVMAKSNDGKGPEVVIPIMNGAALLAADVMKNLWHRGCDPELMPMKISRHGSAELYQPFCTAGKHVLIVDVICDSGETLKRAVNLVINWHCASVSVITLFYENACMEGQYFQNKCRWFGFGRRVSGNHWLFGYGLDISEHGRGLPDVYAVSVEEAKANGWQD